MLRTLIFKKLAAEESKLGVSVDYVRHIVKASLPAFLRFAKIFPVSTYRKRLPVAAKHVAQIVAARDEDCGSCVQVSVNLAQADGVDGDVLRAVVDQAPERLDPKLADVYHFVQAVVGASPNTDSLRTRMIEHYGDEALVELSLAIASSRFFPIVKRTLGYATSCSAMQVEVSG